MRRKAGTSKEIIFGKIPFFPKLVFEVWCQTWILEYRQFHSLAPNTQNKTQAMRLTAVLHIGPQHTKQDKGPDIDDRVQNKTDGPEM